MKGKYGKCAVCGDAITEARYWKALSHRGEAPETCSPGHQTLMRVRRFRGLDATGNEAPGRGRQKKPT